jgi:hypothetical protein
VIPPGQNAAFVANTEDVPEVYRQPFNPSVPVICMDEQPVQLIEERHNVMEMIPGQPQRYDYEYKRNGTAEIFMFTEPSGGFGRVSIREHKTGADRAYEVKELLEKHYRDVSKIISVCDNYSAHKISSFYEAFPAEEARNTVKKSEIHYTPEHESWLNIAETELSSLTRQCPDRRIPSLEKLRSETKAWEPERNAKCKTVDWQFATEDAGLKLKRLYPQFKEK